MTSSFGDLPARSEGMYSVVTISLLANSNGCERTARSARLILQVAVERDLKAETAAGRCGDEKPRQRNVLHGRPGCVENKNLVGTRAASTPARDDLAEFRVHIVCRHKTGGDRVLKLTVDDCLLDDVDNN